jgi:hypothetical protein
MLLRFASAQTGDLGRGLRSLFPTASDCKLSRMGFARLAETSIRKIKGKGETDSLGALDKILASTVGGALATWNQPIEVIRVEVSLRCVFLAWCTTQLIFRCNQWQRAPRTDPQNLPS